MVHVKIKNLMAMVEHSRKHKLADLYEFKASQVCTASTKTTRKYIVRLCLKRGLELR